MMNVLRRWSPALLAILLWASLATMAAALPTLPPFFMSGVALLLGGCCLLPFWRQWRVSVPVFLIGSFALYSYHALLFAAFRLAPPTVVNIINYLWPLLMVVLAPFFHASVQWRWSLLVMALFGFAGAALAVLGQQRLSMSDSAVLGYVAAVLAALIWSTYSLLVKRLPPFSSYAVGGFALSAGVLSLLTSFVSESVPPLLQKDLVLLILLGVGPMGFAFVFWDKAIKQLPAQTVAILSFSTPVLSTLLLLSSLGKTIEWQLIVALMLVVGASVAAFFITRNDVKIPPQKSQ